MEKFLKHHGVLGMRWGVRKGPPYPLSNTKVRFKTGGMDPTEFRRAREKWNALEEFPGLTGKEKERVYEELDNNLTKEEKSYAIVSKRIDDYLYTAINKGHNQYKIIDRERQEPPKTWDEQLSDILDEVVGKDWRKYDY